MTTKLYIPVSELRAGDKVGPFTVKGVRPYNGKLANGVVELKEENADPTRHWFGTVQALIDAFGVDREVEYVEVIRGKARYESYNGIYVGVERVNPGDLVIIMREKKVALEGEE